MVVAIDGPAGVGKSTVARRAAEMAGFLWLSSGSFYRAITWAVLRSGVDPADARAVLEVARGACLEVRDGALVLDGAAVESNLRSDAVDAWVASHSAIPAVREVVNEQLRRVAAGRDVVVDGRDIATVVFPDAQVKVYLDADVGTRARRRHLQGTSSLSVEELERSIAERDRVDRTKPVGRLEVAPGALYVDTSHLTIDEVCATVLHAILKRNNHPGDTRQV